MQRNQFIDVLRGFSMITIIFTHATAFFPNDASVSTLWNWSNFAVPIFIFCSVYLFLQKSSNQSLEPLRFIKKRFIRLLVPYYIFLPFFLGVLLIVSPQMISVKYLWQSLLVIGGVDINWLVLLFLCLTFLLPSFIWSQKKAPILFWLFFILSLGSSIYLLFGQIDMPYKWIMWLPWSLMLYVTWFYLQIEQKKKILFGFFVMSTLVFGLSYLFLHNIHHSTILTHNKYPPNLLYISYGVAVFLGLSFVWKYLFDQKYVLGVLNFFSRYSYSMYFLHYVILTFFAASIKQIHFNGITLFLFVFATTVILQKSYLWLQTKEITKNIYRRVSSQYPQQ